MNPVVAAASIGASMLTASLTGPRYKGGVALCVDCRGKGFDLEREPGKRAARKCPRCRGKGTISVGSTKR